MELPNLRLNGDYDIDARLLVVPIKGTGKFSANIGKVAIKTKNQNINDCSRQRRRSSGLKSRNHKQKRPSRDYFQIVRLCD